MDLNPTLGRRGAELDGLGANKVNGLWRVRVVQKCAVDFVFAEVDRRPAEGHFLANGDHKGAVFDHYVRELGLAVLGDL